MNLEQFYVERKAHFAALEQQFASRYVQLSVARLLIFLAGAAVATFLFTVHWAIGLLFTLVFLGIFYRFVLFHQGIKQQENHNACLKQLNHDEIDHLHHNVSHFDEGKEFLTPTHAYSYDLDFFGPFSIFQHFNRTVTTIGKQRFADLLTHAASLEEIALRQAATRELKEKLEWSQAFFALGKNTQDTADHLRNLKIWAEDPPILLEKKKTHIALYLVPIIVIAVLCLPSAILALQLKLFIFLLPAYFLKKHFDDVNKIHLQTGKAAEMLAQYAQLIEHIEIENFDSPKLKKLRNVLVRDGETVSASLQKLSGIIHQLNVRQNMFAIFLNLFFLWDLHYVLKLERWKDKNCKNLENWFEALREFDAMVSFGILYFNHPEWTFPELMEDGDTCYEGSEIGHPLLKREGRVTNSLTIPRTGYMKLITGSNMAGKSTFCRSVGLSIVFAMMGAPVCAKRLRLTSLEVYTSMRTQDALHESASGFYAELKRLKFIIDAVEAGRPIFFILDEILKGTNSNDRHLGSKALIKQFIRQRGVGLVATHDLELSNLEAAYPQNIENWCFEVAVNGEELDFDYKIRRGVSQSLNASILMRRMGIRME